MTYLKKINLDIGALRIIRNPNEIIWTLLGSCISVIFHVNENHSLICHAQYPSHKWFNDDSDENKPAPCLNLKFGDMKFKYVTCSLEFMINHLIKRGVDLSKVTTTIIGGAAVLSNANRRNSIGEWNIKKAKEILKEYKIKVDREITGGKEGFTIWYYAADNKLIYKKQKSRIIKELK